VRSSIQPLASSDARFGSSTESRIGSASRPLFLKKADADRPRPGTPSIKAAARRPERRLGFVEGIGHAAVGAGRGREQAALCPAPQVPAGAVHGSAYCRDNGGAGTRQRPFLGLWQAMSRD
jgi:hypothetical protein